LSLEWKSNGRWQGRNFGLKVGVPIQKENEAPLSAEARGKENGEEVLTAGT